MNAIEFENISKQYRLGKIGTGTISHDLNRWWHLARGKEDPYLKIGQVNDRTQAAADGDYVWALKDISFNVDQGDVIGIIGRNGAGKSTLLKILSRVTTPTTGVIRSRGRIASLLEVGTGFHPEMSGRENIFMNGSIMGMTKNEIKRKLDEIVDFAGIAKYVDTPVKRYSSGMTVRLGFAIAAFLEPEILVVDEVLAVGDAEFQKKAIGKMQDVSKGEGRTVLFVSHNMAAVKNLCKTGVILKNGYVDTIGNIFDIVERYQNDSEFVMTCEDLITVSDKHRRFFTTKELEFLSVERLSGFTMSTLETITLRIKINNNGYRGPVRISGAINNASGRVGTIYSKPVEVDKDGLLVMVLEINNHNLSKGKYSLDLSVGVGGLETRNKDFDTVYGVSFFDVLFLDEEKKREIIFWGSGNGNTLLNRLNLSYE